MSKLQKANKLFVQGKHKEAYELYVAILDENPDLAALLKANITLCEARSSIRSGTTLPVLARGRVAIFAGYSSKNKIEKYVIHYLKELKKVCDFIVYVCDNPLSKLEKSKLEGLADHVIAERHGEYDFGSYKRGYQYLRQCGLLRAEWLVLCNDSCYGPANEFSGLFAEMERRGADFWGVTRCRKFSEHLQSYFLSFRNEVFNSEVFAEFINNVTVKPSVREVVLSYEVPFTDILHNAGFTWDSFINAHTVGSEELINFEDNLTVYPKFLLQSGAQLIKVKSIQKPAANFEGIFSTLYFVEKRYPTLYAMVVDHEVCKPFVNVVVPGFSVVLAVYNGQSCIQNAINSVLRQDYPNFELIVVDDGSTDGTRAVVERSYPNLIDSGKIKVISVGRNVGVANARNIGLAASTKDWIAYLDADNEMSPYYFNCFSNAITIFPDRACFYASLVLRSNGKRLIKKFNLNELLRYNFIDNGVFVHRNFRSGERAVRHDTNLRRLIDWDFIVSYCKDYAPLDIDVPVLIYNDDRSNENRVSIKESFNKALHYVRSKHGVPYKLTTLVFAFNHEQYIEEALESVCSQNVDVEHEILFLDDASSDGTWKKFLEVSKRHPGKLRGIRHKQNMGQAKNFLFGIRHATGDFIAVIEGDDYWSDKRKLQKQMGFLLEHHDCSMVFSRISVLREGEKKFNYLDRQNGLNKNKLDGGDFLAHSSMNLIGNFSCCMFRRDVIRSMPEFVFEERLTEICVAFHCEQFGPIGYISEPLSVYRQHSGGLWTGASREKQKAMAISARRTVERVADKRWKAKINQEIQRIEAS